MECKFSNTRQITKKLITIAGEEVTQNKPISLYPKHMHSRNENA